MCGTETIKESIAKKRHKQEGRWDEDKYRPCCGWIAVSPGGGDGPSQEYEGVQGLFEQ